MPAFASMRGGIAMTYRVLTFLAYERLEPLLVYVGSALVAFGTRLLQEKKPSP